MSNQNENNACEDGEDKTESAIVILEQQVKSLYEFRDYYLHKNPMEKAAHKDEDIAKELKNVLQRFDELQDEAEKENKAQLFYLKGRALNIQQEHSIDAEQLLSKAIKLDANLLAAWNELGFCYWKKKDIPFTKREQQCQNITEALAKASEAVQLDTSDGLSWLVLGNSYLVHFFSVTLNPQTMKQALAAYLQAEKDMVAKVDADLHFNKGIALFYQEEYLPALEAFSRASALDPSWTMPQEKEQKVIQFLDAAQQLITSKGKLRPKKLHTMLKSLSLRQLGPYEGGKFLCPDGRTLPVKQASLGSLKPGLNKGTVVLGKVVSGIHSDDSVAFIEFLMFVCSAFCLMDDTSCVMVTVYNLAKGKGVIIGDSVAIPEPLFSQVGFSYKDKRTNQSHDQS
ncbi:hypothetical protein B566_EDAN010829 [Ephemera danica]|nr:hypothetical protein B566_EDAN010829 [Ephemera danica]